MPMKDQYQYFVERGICPVCCEFEAAKGHVLCAVCLFERREKAREERMRRQEEGRCQQCGRPCIGSYCSNCKAEIAAYRRERAARLEAHGICVTCGKRLAERGKKQCERCLIKGVERTLKSRKLRQEKLGQLCKPSIATTTYKWD